MKTRVIQIGNYFYPQEKIFFFFWSYVDNGKGCSTYFKDKEEAIEFAKNKLEENKKKVVWRSDNK